ncbi:MAG: tyrosine-type recombinase/integrase [Anaerolineaceae bacterium]
MLKSQNVDQWTRSKTVHIDAIEVWLKSFLTDRKSQNLAQGTLYFYRKKLKLFTDYAHANNLTAMSEITSAHIRLLLISLADAGHNPGGVHAVYRSLRAFLLWYEREAEPPQWANPISNVKPPKLAIEPLEPVDQKTFSKLVKACDTSTFHGARDAAILLFLLDTGVRAFELCALDVDDVDAVSGDVIIRSGKGGKPRMVVAGRRTRKALRTYLRMRDDDEPAMWVDDSGNRLTYWGVNLILKRRSADARVVKPGLHSFRRAFALNCLRAGMDVYSLQKLMGHSDLSVLRRYLAQTDDDLRNAHSKASPVDSWL